MPTFLFPSFCRSLLSLLLHQHSSMRAACTIYPHVASRALLFRSAAKGRLVSRKYYRNNIHNSVIRRPRHPASRTDNLSGESIFKSMKRLFDQSGRPSCDFGEAFPRRFEPSKQHNTTAIARAQPTTTVGLPSGECSCSARWPAIWRIRRTLIR